MQKTALALTLVLALSISLVIFGVQFTKLAEANYIPLPSLWVTSPSYYEFSEFEGDVPLNFHLNVRNSSYALESTVVSYSVDGADNVSFTGLTQTERWGIGKQIYLIIGGETVLSGLSEGNHTVVVYAKTPDNVVLSEAVSFNVKIPLSTPTPEPTSTPSQQLANPFPTPWLIVGSIMIVLVSGFGLLFYMAKRKQSKPI